MVKPIRSIVFAVVVLAATVSAAYTLNLLDQIVHGQLYNYELKFSLDWAVPYWNLLRIVQMLLGVIAAATAVNVVFTLKKYIFVKKPSVKARPSQKSTVTVSEPAVPTATHPVEKTAPKEVAPLQTSAPTQPTPAAASLHADVSGLIRCFHCGKVFSQPLRMLDFQGDRPRIVNICPFCSEIIPAARQNESEHSRKFQLRKKNNDHEPKTLMSQQTS